MHRRRRVFTELDSNELLLSTSLFRDACRIACGRAPVGSSAYEAASKGIDTADHIAEALTGDRFLFDPRGRALRQAR
jgi:hypothetical protein